MTEKNRFKLLDERVLEFDLDVIVAYTVWVVGNLWGYILQAGEQVLRQWWYLPFNVASSWDLFSLLIESAVGIENVHVKYCVKS